MVGARGEVVKKLAHFFCFIAVAIGNNSESIVSIEILEDFSYLLEDGLI
jgi:hypothetical protein